MVLAGELKIAITPAVLEEYIEVLARPKLAAVREKSTELLSRLCALAIRVEPGVPVTEAADEDDNRLLECAIAGSATFLITGNLKDYPAGWPPAGIVNARQFLQTLGIIET
jgi:putative PIN family toxin of toxin-antitoxin system